MPNAGTMLTAQTPFGEITFFEFDKPIGEALSRYGGWAMAEIRFLRQFIAPGDTVLDGGANIGMHSMAFADACGPDGSVIAVEASPEIATVLNINVTKNRLHQVRAIGAALGAELGTCAVERVDPGKPQNVGMLQASSVTATAQLTKLRADMISIDSLGLEALSLIKLDVEGDELAALKGGLATIARLRPTILTEILNLSNALPILDLLVALDYKPFFCSFAAFDPENHLGATENMFGHAREAGLLFLPDAGTIPETTPGAYVAALLNADDLARLIFEMPRYGDRTEHDRIPNVVIAERDRLSQELATIRQDHAQASPTTDETRLMAEVQHVWGALNDMREMHSALAASSEDGLRALRQELPGIHGAQAAADGRTELAIERLRAELAGVHAARAADQLRLETLEHRVEHHGATAQHALDDDRSRLEGLAGRLAEIDMGAAADRPRREALERDVAQLAAAVKRDRDDDRARLESLAGLVGEIDVQAETGGLRDRLDEMSGVVAQALPEVTASATRMAEELRADFDDVVARVKAEVTSLREILTGRNEDRGQTALALERLDRRTAEAIASARDAADAQVAAIDERQRRWQLEAERGAEEREQEMRQLRDEMSRLRAEMTSARDESLPGDGRLDVAEDAWQPSPAAPTPTGGTLLRRMTRLDRK